MKKRKKIKSAFDKNDLKKQIKIAKSKLKPSSLVLETVRETTKLIEVFFNYLEHLDIPKTKKDTNGAR